MVRLAGGFGSGSEDWGERGVRGVLVLEGLWVDSASSRARSSLRRLPLDGVGWSFCDGVALG